MRRTVIFVVAMLICRCVIAGEPMQTVEGPESPNLAQTIRGTVLARGAQGEITATDLPSGRRREVIPPKQPFVVHAISGPSKNGAIAYVEDYYFGVPESRRHHTIKILNLADNTQATLFSRPGSAMWATTAAGHGEIGGHLALDPTGKSVAFLSGLTPRQMPGALLTQGSIEVWDVATTTGKVASAIALDEPMSWFPGGRRLAYSTLVDRDQLPANAPGLDVFGNYFGVEWAQLPAIHILDIRSGTSEFFCVGWTPIVAIDGKTITVGGWGSNGQSWQVVDVASKKASDLDPPGLVGSIVASIEENRTVYWGLPTAGTKLSSTENNSQLRGPKLMLTIKVADPRTRAFSTILPNIDPRSPVSFGSPLLFPVHGRR